MISFPLTAKDTIGFITFLSTTRGASSMKFSETNQMAVKMCSEYEYCQGLRKLVSQAEIV
jgi:hypothetical protein